VTRDRMYLDAMSDIYSNVTKVMVDSKAGSNLLYLPLDKLMQQVAQTPANPSAATPPVSSAPTQAPATTNSSNARSRERESR
jgi:membrane protease subunit HflK